jgi:hypothetical protein
MDKNDKMDKWILGFIGHYGFDGWKCGNNVDVSKKEFRTYMQYLDSRSRSRVRVLSYKANR